MFASMSDGWLNLFALEAGHPDVSKRVHHPVVVDGGGAGREGGARSAETTAAVCAIHFCMKPDQPARTSALWDIASVPALATARWESKATKKAFIPARHTRRGSAGSRFAAPLYSASARVISGSSSDSSTASLDLK